MNEDWNVLITSETTKGIAQKVVLDGREIGKIKNGETIPVILSEGKHTAQLFQKN